MHSWSSLMTVHWPKLKFDSQGERVSIVASLYPRTARFLSTSCVWIKSERQRPRFSRSTAWRDVSLAHRSSNNSITEGAQAVTRIRDIRLIPLAYHMPQAKVYGMARRLVASRGATLHCFAAREKQTVHVRR